MDEPRPPRFLGIAGAATNEEERVEIKRVALLLRYRLQLQDACHAAAD